MLPAPRVLYICGSINQTQQLCDISEQLSECGAAFTPYFGGALLAIARRAGLLEPTIGGQRHCERAARYLEERKKCLDWWGRRGRYDLVVTCSDVVIPPNIREVPIVAVQEGILDPQGLAFELVRRFRWLPRWIAGTGATGLSHAYERFCVASPGYREHFIEMGAPAERVVSTGIPNFDSCEKFRQNDFPHRGYVLVCTSDARETLKWDDRRAFVRKALQVAGNRPLFFKLHPNEDRQRAVRELARWAPHARVFTTGNASEMVANCDVLVTQYSTLAFVGVALHKEVHSFYSDEQLKRWCPEQNGCAASKIADVCRQILEHKGWRFHERDLRRCPPEQAA